MILSNGEIDHTDQHNKRKYYADTREIFEIHEALCIYRTYRTCSSAPH